MQCFCRSFTSASIKLKLADVLNTRVFRRVRHAISSERVELEYASSNSLIYDSKYVHVQKLYQTLTHFTANIYDNTSGPPSDGFA